jgi:hypothetical protein
MPDVESPEEIVANINKNVSNDDVKDDDNGKEENNNDNDNNNFGDGDYDY